MAFEDLFGNNFTTSPGNMTPDPGNFTGGDPSQGNFFDNLFSDQNFIRGLGETGKAFSQGASAGEALGDFASNITRRRAAQKGAMAARGNQRSFQERLLELLGKGELLSPKEQNDAFDSLNLDGDGNVTLSMKNTPQKQGFTRNQPLETMRRPSSGGTNLPNFSNESGGEAFDFAGLDPEDISMLLKAEQQFGQLDQNQMKMILDEKARRANAIATAKQNAARLAELSANRAESKRQFDTTQTNRLEDKQKDRDFRLLELDAMNKNQMNLIAERDKLARIPTAAQSVEQAMRLRKLDSEIDVNNKQIEKMDAEVKVLKQEKGMTLEQQAKIDQINSGIAAKETELGIKLDDIEKEEMASMLPSYVDKDGETQKVPFQEREMNAQQANTRPNNKVYYQIRPEIEDAPGLVWGTDVPGEVIPIMLPRINGKQIYSQDIIDTVGTPNPKTGKPYTEAEVLRSIAILSKQGG